MDLHYIVDQLNAPPFQYNLSLLSLRCSSSSRTTDIRQGVSLNYSRCDPYLRAARSRRKNASNCCRTFSLKSARNKRQAGSLTLPSPGAPQEPLSDPLPLI